MDREKLMKRIDAVDDKTACLIVKILTQELAKVAPADYRSPSAVAQEIARLAVDAGFGGVGGDGAWADLSMSAADSATASRGLLKALAAQPGGDALVDMALSKYRDTAQDFGVLTIGVAAGFFYLAVVCGIEIKLGGVQITKKGLSAKEQVEIAKNLLPTFLKGAFGMAGGG